VTSLSDEERWNAVAARDRRFDGSFVYAVRSTGVYCRVGCPSRRPRRQQVEFFSIPAAAERAGYRACRRCRPREAVGRHPHIALTERAARVLDTAGGVPSLAEVARRVGCSPSHLQRVFRRVTGISPRSYAEARRNSRLRAGLRSGATVSRALYDAGYGSSSRVYEGGGTLGMRPGTYRAGGEGERLFYATAETPLGRVLAAKTQRGLCFVCLERDDRRAVDALTREFPKAELVRDDGLVGPVLTGVVGRIAGDLPAPDLPLDVRGTAFQRQVWEALLAIPLGETITYAELARRIGRPTAIRAVASACAANHLAVVVPCHRVVRSDGGLGGYRWGLERKCGLLSRERSLRTDAPPDRG